MAYSTPAPWTPSDIIRNLRTGKAYIVLHIVKGYATLLAPLMNNDELPYTLTLFPREYDNYCKDANAVLKDGKYQRDNVVL